jgi:hypothetical protein
MPVQKKKSVVHLKSFHSTRHGMSSRLIGAGVSRELARLVTDHDSLGGSAPVTHNGVGGFDRKCLRLRSSPQPR